MELTQSLSQYGVIGAGPSGLAINLFLKTKAELLESNNHVGGHAASFFAAGFTFDYGPHILFSRDQQILDFIIATLGDNVSRCRRNNKISFKNHIIKYPFENDLKSLPLEDNYACIHDFIFNPYKEQYPIPQNMREWFLTVFGAGICSRYLFPYNEKVWNVPVEKLSMALADRIPNPPAEDILKSALGYSTEGYLHQLYYFYPKKGGYQAICEAWKNKAAICYQVTVTQIKLTAHNTIQVIDNHGKMREYQQLISTMPLHEIIHLLDFAVPAEIRQAVEQLIVNPMFLVSFGIQGIDQNQYTAVYFPEAEFWVNRISYPCTFSADNGPANHWSLQAEITCAQDSAIWQKTDAEILAHAKEGLQTRGLLPDDNQISFERVDRVSRSYVVYDVGYEENVKKVRAWFTSLGIHLLGRFSYFEYINVDMAVDRAIKLAIELNGDQGDFNQLKTHYLQQALEKTGSLLCNP